MRRTIFDASIVTFVLYWISSSLLRIFGWHREGCLPDIPKYIMIGAPHTSNRDFLLTLAYAFAFRVKVHWMGKETLFRRPFGSFMRWCGGISIDRSRSHNVVTQTIQIFNNLEKLVMIISPEGTRKKVKHWKTGFYHIAVGAKVPILLGFIDYRRKAGGFGPLIVPTGDMSVDMNRIRAFYETVTAKYPELTGGATVPMRS